MKSLDTNILFTGCHWGTEGHHVARQLLVDWGRDQNVVLFEGVLVELYMLLRNPTVMSRDVLDAEKAVKVIEAFRHHPHWRLVEHAPVMEKVWAVAKDQKFARRRIFDARIAFTLQHHGVTEFATVNLKDFKGFGFQRLWNPLFE